MMRLTTKNIHNYLLDKGFIDMQSLVDGDYMVTQGQTRNLVFRITRKKAKNLFVKQLNSFDQTNTYVLQKDATCLWLIKNTPAFETVSRYVPDYFGFDPERQVLVTEYLANAVNLEDYVRTNGVLTDTMLTELASILASYHFTVSEELRSSSSVQFFPKQIPWVLTLVDAGSAGYQSMLSQASGPVLSAVLGNAGFKELVSGIKSAWSFSSLIHGDIKWMNLLLLSENDQEKIKVIDWEIADIGDPLWDVAGIVQGLVSNTVLYRAQNGGEAFSPVPGIGLNDIREVWTQVRYFWDDYVDKVSNGYELGEAALEKSIRYAGARLIQTATEHNMMMPTLQPNAIKLLQASYALLNNVPKIMAHLYSLKHSVRA